jgi:hypothetical protein
MGTFMKSADNQFLTRERLQDIGLGIARGFQAYDPNNPFAGAGAAMETTIGSGMAREQRQQEREDALSAEQRAESRAERASETAFERQKELVNFRINAEGVAEEAQYRKGVMRRNDEIDMANAEREKAIAQGVFDIDKGRAEIDSMFGEAIGQVVPTIDQTPYFLKAEEPGGDGGEMSWMKGAWKGRITDDSDFSVAADGITNGDYAGMESFDLVRLKDGTPALRVKGGVIPVAANEWMSLMTMRQKMRSELDQRMQFAVGVKRSRDSISRMIAAVPSLQGASGEALLEMASIDPQRAMELSMQAGNAVATGRGRDFTGSAKAEIQQFKNNAALAPWLQSQGDRAVPNPTAEMLLRKNPNADVSMFPPTMQKAPSVRDENVTALRGSKEPRDKITMMAWMNIESFVMPPQLRQIDPNSQIGFIGSLVSQEEDIVTEMSSLTQVQHLAAYGNMGATIPIRDIPYVADPSNMTPQEMQAVKDYSRYLSQVDMWASSVFKWDKTDPNLIDAVAFERIAAQSSAIANRSREQKAAPAKEPASEETTPKTTRRTGSAL